MLRFLLVVVLCLVLLRFLSRLAAVVLRAFLVAQAERTTLATGASSPSIPLVRCARCGVYVPRSATRGSGDAALCRDCAASG